MAFIPSLFNQWKNKRKKNPQSEMTNDLSGQSSYLHIPVMSQSLEKNLNNIKKATGNSPDIIIREIEIGTKKLKKAAVLMTEGLTDDKNVNQFLLDSLLKVDFDKNLNNLQLLSLLEKKILAISDTSTVEDWNQLFSSLLAGEAVILIDGVAKGLATNMKGGEKRQISNPKNELSIRGPHVAFTESLRTNTSLIRRIINNPNLWLESFKIGKVSQTDVNIMYINGICNQEIVQEVRDRLNRIDIDQILDVGYIEQLIEDQTGTFFPTVFYTERPDVVCANLMEGKVAIFADGSPFALTVPALFIDFFQAADDYYARFDISTALRILRIIIFFISLIGPATYVAVTTYHQEMIPTLLLVAIAAQREAIPFPAFFEALAMETTFEILREAGIRLPRAIGQAVSIVGALVIGQAAIMADIVSPAMVIVVSLTAIANFAIPSTAMAITTRIIRFILMTLAAIMGFYGIMFGLFIINLHLCSLRSFGIPYTMPFAPMMVKNLGDTAIRLPLWALKTRPKLISQKNVQRVSNNQKPEPKNNK